MKQTSSQNPSAYERIYTLVRQIPSGQVMTYGQIAKILGGCTARMVGYAMAATPEGSDIPWQRVINHEGKISVRQDGDACPLQQQLLEAEGVHFDHKQRVNLKEFRWEGI